MNAENIRLSVNIGSINIAYDDYGQGDTIIFIHGFPCNGTMWQRQADFLKSQYRVITYDIRGFGDSTSDDERPSMSLYADDLIKFMDALKIEKSIICGLSMGGYIALNAIYRYRARFSGIILCDTQCNNDTQEAKAKRFKTIESIDRDGLDDFASSFIKKAVSSHTLHHNTNVTLQLKDVILNSNVEVIKAALAGLADRWEMCSTLNEILVPCAIICGKEDKITPPDKSQYLHQMIPHSKLKIIDKAGHFSNMEQPDEFNNFVLSFLNTARINAASY